MDEALLKSGQFPNVAIMAGSDPKEVMREHGQTNTEHMDNGIYDHMCPYDSREKQEAERYALKEQINRFNVPKSEEIAENDTSKGVLNNFDVQNDTREKLEADIYRAADEMNKFTHGERFINTHKILRWLDRQAAITRRECSPEAIDYMLNTIGELEEQVDELEAEVEAQRKRANDAERGVLDGRWYVCRDRYEDDIAELTAERDRLQAKVDELNANWRKANDGWAEANAEAEQWRQKRDQLSRDLDAEHALVVQFEYDNEKLRDKNSRQRRQLSELQDAIRDRNQGVLKRQWKRQVDELTAERDKFADERDCMAGRVIELTAERDQHSRGWAKANMGWAEANAEAEQWRQKCDQLKADLKTANDTINTLRASVAGLKETVEKLGAK